MKVTELTQEELNNLITEIDQLKDQLAVAEVKHKAMRAELDIARQGLGMAHLDQLPKEVADMARARNGAGLPMSEAIQCAIRQYASDQKHAKEAEEAEARKAKETDDFEAERKAKAKK